MARLLGLYMFMGLKRKRSISVTIKNLATFWLSSWHTWHANGMMPCQLWNWVAIYNQRTHRLSTFSYCFSYVILIAKGLGNYCIRLSLVQVIVRSKAILHRHMTKDTNYCHVPSCIQIWIFIFILWYSYFIHVILYMTISRSAWMFTGRKELNYSKLFQMRISGMSRKCGCPTHSV